MGALLLLLLGGLALKDLLLAPLALETRVAARPKRELAAFEMQDVVRDVVEQIPVVADDEKRRGLALEIIGEPEHAFEVEIVGRLVEQQNVGRGKEDRRKRHAHSPAAREFGERAVLRRLVEAEAGENARDPRRGGMGVDVGKPRLDLGDALRIGRCLGLDEEARPLDVGFEHEVDQRLRAARRLLFDAAKPSVLRRKDGAALRRKLAADQAEERRLARAVAPDEPDARARRQRDGRVVDEQALAEPVSQAVHMQHGAAFRPFRAFLARV